MKKELKSHIKESRLYKTRQTIGPLETKVRFCPKLCLNIKQENEKRVEDIA